MGIWVHGNQLTVMSVFMELKFQTIVCYFNPQDMHLYNLYNI